MDGRKLLGVVVVGLMLRGGAAWAATPACAAEALGVPPQITPLVRTTHDPATGATIVLRREAGRVTVELADKDVVVRKTFDGKSAVTTLSRGGQKVAMTLTGGSVLLTTPGKTWSGTLADLSAIDEAAAYLQASTPAISAKRLLDRVSLNPNTIEGNALLLTRGLLGTLWGETAAVAEHQRWATARAYEPQIARVRLPGGPADCWNLYSAEAIRIRDDLTDCFSSCSVLRFTCRMSCGFLYEVRAEGAFMWFVSCSGGFYVR